MCHQQSKGLLAKRECLGGDVATGFGVLHSKSLGAYALFVVSIFQSYLMDEVLESSTSTILFNSRSRINHASPASKTSR
jgi:hypothetical protein